MNQQSNIFNQQIDLEPEGTFASPIIPVFSNNLSEGSESCFSGKVKLPDPPKFDGTPKEFQAFESSTHLLGPAMIWFTSMVKDNDPCLSSYERFLAQFRRNFSDPNIAINAREMLRKCNQGGRSVAAYATHFRVLGRESGYDQLALVDQFLRGLNYSVMNYLMVTEIPDRLEDCIDAAMLIDLRLSNRDMFLRDRPT
ncbi:Retrotransposon-derived protein PEG10 [Smittium culicis]|uniref:Retrotransposon-derived protein PEG10 n=1 Tax=Smittium culicis TaxID=133412 RepID=A0A1R1X1Y8_9FUNG|nr:Retrotransposon-derived protein PEG10 [Smittium culicis]OMJ15750.1 Retrotransposon-derived protein PEG10 [Smittium culicis]